MSKQPTVNLPNNVVVSAIAYGTGSAWYKGKNDGSLNLELVRSIKQAIKTGYRHIDTAEIYGTEKEVGVAIEESDISRDELFVTTKVSTNIHEPAKALRESLSRLKLNYVDLYLIHSPFFDKSTHGISHREAWKELEKLLDQGLTKAIGVSNFRIQDFEDFLSSARIKPAVNQIELHPYLQSRQLLSYTGNHGILTAAYGSLVPIVHKPGGPVDSVVRNIARKYSKSEGQILLKWSLHKGNIVITTSSKPQRLNEYLSLGEFDLSDDDVRAIDEAGEQLEHRQFWSEKF